MGQTHNKYGFWPVRPDAPITYLKIAATQTLTKGDAVIFSSGQVAIALANSAELCGVIAEDCASLDANTLVPVYADPETEFEGIMDADSSSVTAGSEVDIIGATGAMMLDADASSIDATVAIAPNPDDDTSSAYCRWRFKINKHAFADQS